MVRKESEGVSKESEESKLKVKGASFSERYRNDKTLPRMTFRPPRGGLFTIVNDSFALVTS